MAVFGRNGATRRLATKLTRGWDIAEGYGLPREAPAVVTVVVGAIGVVAAVRGGSSLPRPLEGCLLGLALAPWVFGAARCQSQWWLLTAVPPVACLQITGSDPLSIVLLCIAVGQVATLGTRLQTLTLAAATLSVAAVRQVIAPDAAVLLFSLFGVATSILAGLVLRALRELGACARADLHIEVEGVRLDERSRVAREVHDVIAHSMTVSLLHVQSARLLIESDLPAAAAELDHVVELFRSGLNEIQHAVAQLRGGHGAPDLADFRALVRSFRDAGVDLDVQFETGGQQVSDAVKGTLFAVMREAIANAARHAMPATRVGVVVGVGDTSVSLRVVNRLPPGWRMGFGGQGVLGIRERARLVGGRASAGPVGEEWVVECVLPAGERNVMATVEELVS